MIQRKAQRRKAAEKRKNGRKETQKKEDIGRRRGREGVEGGHG